MWSANLAPPPPRRPRPRKDQAGAVCVHSKVYFLGFPKIVCKDVGGRRLIPLQAPLQCVCVFSRLGPEVRDSWVLIFNST